MIQDQTPKQAVPQPTYADLIDPNTLQAAWRKVASKNKKGGVDRQTVGDFADNADKEIADLLKELTLRTYIPEPYMEVKMPKKDNEIRSLGLLTVRDKVVQQALTDVLTPFFEPKFMESSYAYRPNRGTQHAVRRVQTCIQRFENRWLVRCDIDRFFDNIPHALLEKQLRFFLKDEDLVRFILLCVGMGKVGLAGEKWQSSEGKGIPQGGILSPLLANIYLHQLDFFIFQMHRPLGYVRFADDFVVLTREKNQAEAVGKRIVEFLTKRLGLVLDEYELLNVAEGFSFLGLAFNTEGVGLDDAKRTDLLSKQTDLLQFDFENGLNPKYIEFVEGLSRYHSQVMKAEALLFFDEQSLKTALANVQAVKAQNQNVSNRQIRSWLERLPFLTPLYRQQKNNHINELMNGLKNAKMQKIQDVNNVTQEAKGKQQEVKSKEQKQKESTSPPITNNQSINNEINQPLEISPQKLIDKKRREYEDREGASMELVISHAGVYLGLARRQITVRLEGKNLLKNPTANIRHITVLAKGVTVSSNLIWHCSQQNIPIVFHDTDGKPFAKIFSTDDADADLWLAQSQARANGKGATVAREIAEAKVTNQLHLLKYFGKHHNDHDLRFKTDMVKTEEFMKKSLEKLSKLSSSLAHTEMRQQIMAQEGNAAQSYWQQLKHLITDETDFTNREHQGARDLTNMLLNYGYGILYGRVWAAVLNARLHPSVSFLHEPNRGKPTLVFDMVEEFRAPIVDRTVVSLINRQEKLTTEKDGKLSIDTRRRLAEKILERINTLETFRGQRLRLADIMRLQSVNLAKYLKGENKTYKPYVMKW